MYRLLVVPTMFSVSTVRVISFFLLLPSGLAVRTYAGHCFFTTRKGNLKLNIIIVTVQLQTWPPDGAVVAGYREERTIDLESTLNLVIPKET